MKRAFQNKCGSTLGKIPLFIYIDIPNKIASHSCFVTDTALPGICNNQILVRQLSKLCFVCCFFFFQGKTVACSFVPPAWLCIPPLACSPKPSARRSWASEAGPSVKPSWAARLPESRSLSRTAEFGHSQTRAKFLSPSPWKHDYCH